MITLPYADFCRVTAYLMPMLYSADACCHATMLRHFARAMASLIYACLLMLMLLMLRRYAERAALFLAVAAAADITLDDITLRTCICTLFRYARRVTLVTPC